MESKDETLTCQDCGKEFIFTAEQQKRFQELGFENKPKRCLECRAKKKEQRVSGKKYQITCSKCGQTGFVPFEPRDPSAKLLCEKCFQEERGLR